MSAWLKFVRRWVPPRVRHTVQRFVSLQALKLRDRERNNPLADMVSSDENREGSPVRFGIVRNMAQYHRHFVQACLEESVPFRVLDLYRDDWLSIVQNSGCRVLLVWPDAIRTDWSTMIKDRVAVLEALGYPAVPSSAEIWMYEDKKRMAYWLQAQGLPHPRTWIFYDRDAAECFVAKCALPVVLKTNFGAAGAGVWILRRRGALRSAVRRAFTRGFVPAGHERRDRQWGSVILQEFLPEVREWRMVRIGDASFGHPKGRRGEFHSGSGRVEWDLPEPRHLDLLHRVTEAGGFRSMDVDVFETPDGRLWVNELQAVFGASLAIDQLRRDGVPGRMIRTVDGSWRFESGDFARNACANARIRDTLQLWAQDGLKSRRSFGPAIAVSAAQRAMST